MGNAGPCIATEALEELVGGDEQYQEKRKVIHDALGSVYSGEYFGSFESYTCVLK